jgi:hypothetical protein
MSLWGYTQRSEPVSTRTIPFVNAVRDDDVVVARTCDAVDVRCVIFSLLAVSTGLSTLLRPDFLTAMVSAKGRGGSAARAAVHGTGAGILGAGEKVDSKAGAKVGPLGAECCHLAGEVLDTLQSYVAFGV